jgi:hypothetical protein
MRAPRQAIKGYQGVGTITDSVYYLPLLDAGGNIQVIRAHGVDEIAVVARTRLPPIAREIFPVIRAFMPWMETGAGHVELLIGLDNKQWLPAHVEDSWDPDDDIRLMRSVFGHRYMITDGWGRDLFPPDNAPGNQAGAQGGGAEPADAAQEVQLPEYRGWSQGTWSHENGGRPDATNPRDGCLGARPKSHGVTFSRGVPPTQRKTSQRGGSRGPSRESRDPPASQARVGTSHSQASGRARPRLRMIPPPKKRPSPNPPLTPGWGNRSRGGSSRGGRGQRGAVRMQPPRRPPLPDPERMPSPLQLMGPGDPMQRLALMMAVMVGMPPVSGYHASVGLGEQGIRDRAESMFPPSAWFDNSRGTLAAEREVSPAAPHGGPPVEPGGFSVQRILQQVKRGMEGLPKIKEEVQRAGQEAMRRNSGEKGWYPGPVESGQENRPRREAAQKAMDALKKGADATRGRGRRKGRMYPRTGVRN